MRSWRFSLARTMVLVSFLGAASWSATGQQELPKLDLAGQLGIQAQPQDSPVRFAAEYRVAPDGKSGRLDVRAELQPGWHIYSTTQGQGALPTVISVLEPKGVLITGPFVPDAPPKVRVAAELGPGTVLEEHEGSVTWSAPIVFPESVDPNQLVLRVKIEGQICDPQGCVPVSQVVEARYAGAMEPRDGAERGQELAASHISWSGQVDTAAVRPGQQVRIRLRATPSEGWHVYVLAGQGETGGSYPTRIRLIRPEGWKLEEVRADKPPVVKETQDGTQAYYEGPVEFLLSVRVPVGASPGPATMEGFVGYQVCTSDRCDRPSGLRFSAQVLVDPAATAAQPQPLQLQEASYGDAMEPTDPGQSAAPALQLEQLRPTVDETSHPLWYAVLVAFLGGFVLNFMPCVLPVIGLKVMSLIHQAGESRWRAMQLNLVYVSGLMSIFLLLATLTVMGNYYWGRQAQSPEFNIIMAAVVFVMGLSFLGVWEIPIPGFVGSGKAAELAHREGYTATFIKGCITTILAIPCSGPGLATAIAWCTGKPPHLVFLVFISLGLGMGSPYLVIGAFPRLLKFLPKPGPWMETFKEFMGFLLLGTVVYLLTLVPLHLVIPTVAMLTGLWLACWWIGRLPAGSDLHRRVRAWAVAVAIAIGSVLFSYQWLAPIMHARVVRDMHLLANLEGTSVSPAATTEQSGQEEAHLPWEPFSLARLDEEIRKGNTVLVDFTADW